MRYDDAVVKSVKADYAKGVINLTFSVKMDGENDQTSLSLAEYVDPERGRVELVITPNMVPMFPVSIQGSIPAVRSFTASNEEVNDGPAEND